MRLNVKKGLLEKSFDIVLVTTNFSISKGL